MSAATLGREPTWLWLRISGSPFVHAVRDTEYLPGFMASSVCGRKHTDWVSAHSEGLHCPKCGKLLGSP